MKIVISIVLAAFILMLTDRVVLGQVKEIVADEYYAPLRSGFPVSRKLSRRQVSKTEVFRDGKVWSTDEWTYEYDVPDNIRYVNITNFNGTTRRVEEIVLGKTMYCKRDDGVWKPVQAHCIGGGISGFRASATTKYTVELVQFEGKNASLYREYSTYKYNNPEKPALDGFSYSESKYWIDSDGRVLHEERSEGLLDPIRVESATITTYEYDPKIKIEAPIK